MSTGHPDLYKGFVWRFWALINDGVGRMGVVLPRSVFATKGAAEFRKEIFGSGTVEDMTNLVNNAQWVFEEVHPQYTVTLISLRKLKPDSESMLPMRGPYASLRAFKIGTQSGPMQFPVDDVYTWTNTVALPLLPDGFAGEVFAQLRKAPNLDFDDGISWRARPYQELNATNDKEFMEVTVEPEDSWWPVYKGASFDIWNPDTGTYYAWAKPERICNRLQTKRMRGNSNRRSVFSEFPREWVMDESTLPAQSPRIALRLVTRATDSRTIRVALIPPNRVAQHGAPVLVQPRGDAGDQAFLLGVLSAIPTDWYARRFVEIRVDFHILNALPIPRPTRDNPLWQRAVALSGRLAAVDERYADWAAAVGVDYGPLDPVTKDDMIFELDAVVAHLYGLDAAQLSHIFATFHVGWDYQARLRAVLEHFRAWQGRL